MIHWYLQQHEKDELPRRTSKPERRENLVKFKDRRPSHDENNTASAARESSGLQMSDEMTGPPAPTQRAVSAQVLYAQTPLLWIFNARCKYIYISRLCYDVSVRLSVRLSVTEVHWRIRPIANLGFKFRSKFTAHCGRGEG